MSHVVFPLQILRGLPSLAFEIICRRGRLHHRLMNLTIKIRTFKTKATTPMKWLPAVPSSSSRQPAPLPACMMVLDRQSAPENWTTMSCKFPQTTHHRTDMLMSSMLAKAGSPSAAGPQDHEALALASPVWAPPRSRSHPRSEALGPHPSAGTQATGSGC